MTTDQSDYIKQLEETVDFLQQKIDNIIKSEEIGFVNSIMKDLSPIFGIQEGKIAYSLGMLVGVNGGTGGLYVFKKDYTERKNITSDIVSYDEIFNIIYNKPISCKINLKNTNDFTTKIQSLNKKILKGTMRANGISYIVVGRKYADIFLSDTEHYKGKSLSSILDNYNGGRFLSLGNDINILIDIKNDTNKGFGFFKGDDEADGMVILKDDYQLRWVRITDNNRTDWREMWQTFEIED